MNDSKFPEVMVGAKLISTRDKELFLERSNNMEIEPLENGICTSASPNDAFPLISVLYRMLKSITNEDLTFFKNPGTSIKSLYLIYNGLSFII